MALLLLLLPQLVNCWSDFEQRLRALFFFVLILMVFLARLWLLFVITLYLMGCASGSTPLADVLLGVVSERLGTTNDAGLLHKPNPLYRYLRIEVVGQPAALLVLGYVDAHPQGDIEVWYSTRREVIKTQNGRIVGTSGLVPDWRRVQYLFAPPSWADVPPEGVAYTRLRDEMPGYHAAISDQLVSKPWAGLPALVLPATLSVELASSYRWFSETPVSSSAQPLPPSWFAWGLRGGQPTVVYSEQCLSASYCIKLQPWPAQESVP